MVTFAMSRDDFLAGQQLGLRRRRSLRWLEAIALLAVLAGAVETVVHVSQGSPLPSHAWKLVVVGLFMFGWTQWTKRREWPRQAAKFYDAFTEPNPAMTVTWTGAGVRFSDIAGEKSVSWSDVSGSAENERLLVFWTRKGVTWTLVKTAFSEGELQDFRGKLGHRAR